MNFSLTNNLLKRGDRIEVYLGQLAITPKSGEPVPRTWLAKNGIKIMSEIAKQLDEPIYSYAYYRTGIYNKGRSPGVMIRFIDLRTGEDVYALFNAHLKRQRTIGNKKVGDPLPEGHFHLGDRSAFYMLWIKTALTMPRRFSEWHKSMSKLQHIYFIGERSSGDKLANKSIQPLSLTYKNIEQLFRGNMGASERQASDNLVTRNGGKDLGQKMVANTGDKHFSADYANKGLEPDLKCVSKEVRVFESAGDLSACAANRVLSNQVMTGNVVSLTTNKKLPQDQTNDEWFQDYDSASERL